MSIALIGSRDVNKQVKQAASSELTGLLAEL
jgi:hypothetical protein